MARNVGAIHAETSRDIDQADEIKKAKLLGPEDADSLELRINDLTKKCVNVQASADDKEFRFVVNSRIWVPGERIPSYTI